MLFFKIRDYVCETRKGIFVIENMFLIFVDLDQIDHFYPSCNFLYNSVNNL